MTSRRVGIAWWCGAAAVTILSAGAFWAAGGRTVESDPLPQAQPVSLAQPLPTASAPDPAWTGENPASLDSVARMFDLGMAGDLRLDMDTRSALELTLAQLGDTPGDDQLARVEASLRKELPPAAAREAIALVHSYRAYKAAHAREFAQAQPVLSMADVSAQLAQQEALQRRFFDADTVKALFGAQTAHTRHLLEVQAIEGDANLSAAEKVRRIAVVRQRLPLEVAELEGAVMPPAEAELQRTVAALRERGAPEADVQRARVQVLGADAAASLAEQEQQRDQFEGRLQAYMKERTALAAPTTAQQDELLRKHFSADEVATARAYERTQTR